MNISDAKIIVEEIKKSLDYDTNRGVSPKKLNKLKELSDKFRPGLFEFISERNLTFKYHFFYCFLNDIEPHGNMRFFKFDKDLNRITNEISLKEFAYIHRPQGAKTNRVSLLKVYDAGLDLVYPKLNNYSCEKINKICRRIVAKHNKCVICCKWHKIKHMGHKLCSDKCFRKYRSIIQTGANNTVHRQSPRTKQKVKEKLSKILKDKIARGEWTPEVTNSWANSKVNLKMFNLNFRSTWEAYFYAKMKKSGFHIEYEKVRIKYFDTVKGKTRVYITDFVDYENKIIYEVKPSGYKDSQNVTDKELAAKEWCLENGFSFEYISNSWFKQNYDTILLEELNNEKVTSGMRQFK